MNNTNGKQSAKHNNASSMTLHPTTSVTTAVESEPKHNKKHGGKTKRHSPGLKLRASSLLAHGSDTESVTNFEHGLDLLETSDWDSAALQRWLDQKKKEEPFLGCIIPIPKESSAGGAGKQGNDK